MDVSLYAEQTAHGVVEKLEAPGWCRAGAKKLASHCDPGFPTYLFCAGQDEKSVDPVRCSD